MKLQDIIDDIDSTCSTCEECSPSCAAYIMKVCIEGEIENEDLLQSLSPEVVKIIEI